jgi:hypothetical protein
MLNMYVSKQRHDNYHQAALPDRHESEEVRRLRSENYRMHLQLRKGQIIILNLRTLTVGIYYQMRDIPHLTWKPVDFACILNNGAREAELRKVNRGINLELMGYQIPPTYDGGHGPGLSMKCFYLKGIPPVYSHAKVINMIQLDSGPLSIYYPELIDEEPFRNTGIAYIKFIHLEHAVKFLKKFTSATRGGGEGVTDCEGRFSRILADASRIEIVAPFGPDNLRNDTLTEDTFAAPNLGQLRELTTVVRAKGSRGPIHWDELMDQRFINEKALELWWDAEENMWMHDARFQGTAFAMSRAEEETYDRRDQDHRPTQRR